MGSFGEIGAIWKAPTNIGALGDLADRAMGRSSLAAKRAVGLVERNDHFVLLVDVSGSMRPLAKSFPARMGEMLDRLADEHPGALVSVWLYNERPIEQYARVPVDEAATVQIEPRLGTDLPCALMEGVGLDSLVGNESVVILTDGDCRPHHSRHTLYETRHAVLRAKRRGVRFVLLTSDLEKYDAIRQAESIGLEPHEVRLWEHTDSGLRRALDEAADYLALPSSR